MYNMLIYIYLISLLYMPTYLFNTSIIHAHKIDKIYIHNQQFPGKFPHHAHSLKNVTGCQVICCGGLWSALVNNRQKYTADLRHGIN